MRKILSLLFVLSFVGSVMASQTVTYVFSNKDWHASPANWENVKSGSGFSNHGVLVSTTSTGASAICPDFYYNISQVVITYNTNYSAGAGTFEVQVGSTMPVSQPWGYSGSDDGENANFTTTFNFAQAKSGKVQLTAHCTTNSAYIVSVAITYTYDPSAPLVYADDVGLGTVILEGEETSYVKEVDVDIQTANLANDVTVECPSGIVADKSKIDKAGGSLHLTITAPVGEFSKTVTLTSGSTVYSLGVYGIVKKYIALPGTAATMTAGTNATAATVDGKSAIRVGSSTNGRMTITVPSGANMLHFYAAAASGSAENGNIKISAPDDNAVLGGEAINQIIKADGGIVNDSPFTLEAYTPTLYRIDVPLINVTATTNITLQTGTIKRFVVWGATYEVGVPAAIEDTQAENKTIKTIENGQLVIIRDSRRYNALGALIR